MQLNSDALARLTGAKMRPEAVATIFEHLTMMANEFGVASAVVTLDYQGKDDKVQEGDVIPVITLSVRPATPTDNPNP